jgi:glycosyltransferase involved in cell wall biosynthesis
MKADRKLTVALAMSSFFPAVGGAQVTANNLGRYLTNQGHTVVAFVSPRYWRALRHQKSNFPYKILPMFPFQQSALPRFGKGYLKLQDIYLGYMQRKYKFDVWQSFGTYPAGVSISHFAYPRGIPHVVRAVGYDIQRDSSLGYGYRLNQKIDDLISQWTPKASRTIALTESVIPDLLDAGVPRDRIRVVSCGVNYERFTTVPLDRANVRAKYGIPLDVFTYITVGRNHPKKGFPVLVKALAELKVILPRDPFHCVFVGRGMDQLKPLAQELGVAESVTFVDEVGASDEDKAYEMPSSPLIHLYRSADASAYPSLLEAHGTINIEAMAAGIPVVSTNAPGVKETIEDGFNGLVATAGDPKSLAEKMAEIQMNPKRREQLIQNGVDTILKKYNWSIVVKVFESIYMDLTAK